MTVEHGPIAQVNKYSAKRLIRLAGAAMVVLTLPAIAERSGWAMSRTGANVQPATGFKAGEPFELKVNETRTLAGDNLRVRFDGVTGDSRCPTGVQCIWAGDATVELTLEKPPIAADTSVLHTSERFNRETDYAGLVIRLLDLQPRPREGATIAPEDYRVKLVVERKP